MDKLNELLNEFSRLTDKILEELPNQEYDQVNLSLDHREEIINQIKEIKYDRAEFNKISLLLNLEKEEIKLNKALKEKFTEKKDALDRISKAKHVSKEYRKVYSVDSIFINKKI